MNSRLYKDFIDNTIRTEGWRTADFANKLALKMEIITTTQYSAAARRIVAAYMAEGEEANVNA